MALTDWNTDPSLNAVQPGINWAEGMQPAAINNSARQVMADIAAFIKNGTAVNPMIAPFNAKCDGVTDDTAALTAAVAYCCASASTKMLLMPGKSYITGSIPVARLVDTMVDDFFIIGMGPQAGFYTDKAISIFSSSVALPGSPQSENIALQNIRFEAANAATATYAFSQDFLRLKFHACYFHKMKVVTSTFHLQDWAFSLCVFRYWNGATFKAHSNIFHCVWDTCRWEAGGQDGIQSEVGGFFGSTLAHNLFEGCRSFFQQAGGNGVHIVGNYTEGNSARDYVFTDIAGGGASRGISFIGNTMVTSHGLFNVGLGDVRGFVSAGNYCSDKMFDMTSTHYGRVQSIGDYAETTLFSTPAGVHDDRPVRAAPTAATTIVAHAGGGRAGAPTLTAYFNRIATCATANDSVLLPDSDYIVQSEGLCREYVIHNDGAANLQVLSSQSDLTNLGVNLNWIIAPGATATIIQYGAGLMEKL